MKPSPLMFVFPFAVLLHFSIAFGAPASPEPPKKLGPALAWTFGVTAAPVAAGAWMMHASPHGYSEGGALLIGTGLLLGPSSGLFYAEAPGHAMVGIGIRLVGLGVGLFAASMACVAVADECSGEGRVVAWMMPGVLYSVFNTVIVVERLQAVARANERARMGSGSRTSLSPALLSVGNGSYAPGLAFKASF